MTVVTKDQKQIPGPILDRIAVHVQIPCVEYANEVAIDNALTRCKEETHHGVFPYSRQAGIGNVIISN